MGTKNGKINPGPAPGKGVRVSLIIPCHNEAARLSGEKVLATLKLLGERAETVLVDDGSTDGTGGVIRGIEAKSPAVKTLSLPKNIGKGEAVRTAMLEAAGRGAEYVGFCDADFATPPDGVAEVFAGLASDRSAEAAIATRNSPESENISRHPLRKVLSYFFSLISSFVLKRRITDSQCGAKFFKNTPNLIKALEEPFISRWGFDVEIIGRLEAAQDETGTVEVPLKSWREKLPSRLNPLSMVATLFEMAEINRDLKRRRKRNAKLWIEVALTVFVRMIPIYILTYVLGKILFWEGYWVNPDAYYHMGVGIAYADRGWLSDFPWLKYTVLGDGFPNVYLIQHLLLAFLYGVIPSSSPIVVLKSAIMVMAFLQMTSFYLFLRKWKVGYSVIWAVLAITVSSNMLWHTIALKGITLFSIVLPWIADALWSNSGRRAFTIGWVSAYTYVGFIILLPLVACRVAGLWLFEAAAKTKPPAGSRLSFPYAGWLLESRLKLKTPLLLFAGIALGMVLSPFFPDHLFHIAREIKTVFERPEFIKAGDFFGSEWSIPSRVQLQHFLGGMILLSLAATLFYMRKDKHCDALAGSALITVFVFALLPFRGGIKFAQVFIVVAALMVPLIYRQISEVSFRIPKLGVNVRPILPAVFAFIFLTYSLPFIKQRQIRQRPSAPTPKAYETITKAVRALTEKGKVVIAPWDDFPGLFYFNRDNHYVSGMNNLFLYHNDSYRFTSYYKFFKGGIKNPAASLPLVFDGADLILVRDTPRVSGEVTMNKVLDNAPNLVRVSVENGRLVPGKDVVAGYWRVYKIINRPPAAGGTPDAGS